VFLRQDAIRRVLEPPYSGPKRVTARTDKTFKIIVRDRPVTVSADRVKPSVMLAVTQHDPPVQPRKVPDTPQRTTRSGHSVPGLFHHLSCLLTAGVMWLSQHSNQATETAHSGFQLGRHRPTETIHSIATARRPWLIETTHVTLTTSHTYQFGN
jgi:hypothetical protein